MIEDDGVTTEDRPLGRWEQHKFMLLVGLTIVISLFLVGVAMALYNSSGAAQLDLSRPGYQSVREQANKPDDFEGFSSTGSLDDAAINEFKAMYDEKSKEATAIDSFGGDVMSDETLIIDAPKQ